MEINTIVKEYDVNKNNDCPHWVFTNARIDHLLRLYGIYL